MNKPLSHIRTVSDLKRYLGPANYFFARGTLKHFGQTMRSFSMSRGMYGWESTHGYRVLAPPVRVDYMLYGRPESAYFGIGKNSKLVQFHGFGFKRVGNIKSFSQLNKGI